MLPPGPRAPAWPAPPAAGGSAAGKKLQRRRREPVPSLSPPRGRRSFWEPEPLWGGGAGCRRRGRASRGGVPKSSCARESPPAAGLWTDAGGPGWGTHSHRTQQVLRGSSLRAVSRPLLWLSVYNQTRPKRWERSGFRRFKTLTLFLSHRCPFSFPPVSERGPLPLR